VHTAYLRPGLSDVERAKAVDMAPWICETVVDGEDFWVAGRTEPGVRAGLLDAVVFGRNEPAPQHLHRGFAAALGRPPPRGMAPSRAKDLLMPGLTSRSADFASFGPPPAAPAHGRPLPERDPDARLHDLGT
jgi:hypothetical protein